MVLVSGPGEVVTGDLAQLARLRGVHSTHVDGRGRIHQVDEASLIRVLNAFGDLEAMTDPGDATRALRQLRHDRLEHVVEPVYLVDEGLGARVPIRLARRAALECRVEF